MTPEVLECVVNISEGRNSDLLSTFARAAAPAVLDVHSDSDHNRSVLTLAGSAGVVTEAVRTLARMVVATLDLTTHEGVHPRIGTLDVVPFVALRGWPLEEADPSPAMKARDDFCRWAATALDLPCYVYGPERSLPEVRRRAWKDLRPDFGPDKPHPRAGASAVGCRPVLVAYNLWLAETDLRTAKEIAVDLRGPQLRTLGLQVGTAVQVSCNLVAPYEVGPGAVYGAVAARARVERAELVGLLPRAVLHAEPSARHRQLGIDDRNTIEARLEQAGLDGGRFD